MSNERTTFDALLPDPAGQLPYLVDLVRALRAEIADLKRISEPLQRDKSDYQVLQALQAEAGGVQWGPPSGTWTPIWLASVTNPTVTYAAQLGYYARIGPVTLVGGQLQISAIAVAAAGTLRLGGLPFTVGASQGQRGGFAINFTAGLGAATAPTAIVPVTGQTYGELTRRSSADARDNVGAFMQGADLTATTNIYFSGLYFL